MKDFYKKFTEMEPMYYYEGTMTSPKAKAMLTNKDDNYIATLKRDGEWARIIISEEGVLIQSRNISRVTGTYGDKTAQLPHIVKAFEDFPVGSVFIGELAFPVISTTSRDVGTILRCLPAKAIERQKDNPLHFYIFDMLADSYEDLTQKPYIERLGRAMLYTYNDFVEITTIGYEFDSFMDFADSVWAAGGEGIVIHKKDTFYEPGKRTAWNSLKVKKKMEDLKVKIVGLIEPNKNYDGKNLSDWTYFVDEKDRRLDVIELYHGVDLGEIIPVTKPYWKGWKNGVKIEYNGRIVSVTSGLTDEIRAYLATDEALEKISNGNMYAIITGMELTPDSIRHPIFKSLVK